MGKTLLSLLAFILLLQVYSFGQACTPDPQYTNTSSQKGTHPDTATNFSPAYVGVPYSQTLTIVIPPDTTVPFLGAIVWDSTTLASFTGLPAGFTYSCSNTSPKPNRCSWKGNSIGCLVITGTPASGDVGTHPLQFIINNYVGGSPSPNPFTVNGYKIVVSASSGISENPEIQVIEQNNPNPFSDRSEILFTSNDNGTAQFKIYNMIGTVVQQYDIAVRKGTNKLVLDAKDFESGIYFYSIVSGRNVFTRKMVVKK